MNNDPARPHVYTFALWLDGQIDEEHATKILDTTPADARQRLSNWLAQVVKTCPVTIPQLAEQEALFRASCQNTEYAMRLMEESNQHWQKLAQAQRDILARLWEEIDPVEKKRLALPLAIAVQEILDCKVGVSGE